MTPELQQRVRELASGESVMLCTGVKAFRHRHTGRVVYMVKSNRPEMPNGATQITFETFDEAFALVRKLGITRKLPAYSDAESKYFAGFAETPTADDADNSADCAALADVPLIDPLLNALDDAHKFISDATVDGDVARLRIYTMAYAQICETLAMFVGSSQTP